MSCTEDKDINGPSVPGDVSISGTIPVLYIDTENGAPVVSKRNISMPLIGSTLWERTMLNPSGLSLHRCLCRFAAGVTPRGRGAKKPYKIKLDKKTEMMGMPENKIGRC